MMGKRIFFEPPHSVVYRLNYFFCALCLFCAVLCASCDKKESARTQTVLGTVCSINAYTDGTPALYDILFSRLEEIEQRFSVHRDDSDISAINRAAGVRPVFVHNDVFYVISVALFYAELSGGLFDPTVGPLVSLWNINSENPHVPSSAELQSVLPLIDWRKVSISASDGNSVFLHQAGMALDLGAIVKGYAADEMARILGEQQVKAAIINLGGNVYAFGKKPNSSVWNIGIKNPELPESEPAAVIHAAPNTTVVTSGAYERFFVQNGIRYHHILNPRTGFPAESSVASATVVWRSSLDADALSTIAFLLGPEAYSRLPIFTNPEPFGGVYDRQLGAVFIATDGSIQASKNLSQKIEAYGALPATISFF